MQGLPLTSSARVIPVLLVVTADQLHLQRLLLDCCMLACLSATTGSSVHFHSLPWDNIPVLQCESRTLQEFPKPACRKDQTHKTAHLVHSLWFSRWAMLAVAGILFTEFFNIAQPWWDLTNKVGHH